MIKFTADASLRPFNTFGLDAKADLLVEYTSEDDLSQIFHDSRVAGKPFLHVGQGSNLLFTGDYHGVVLHSGIKGIRPTSQGEDVVLLECGAGESWDGICAWCVDHGFYGVENLSGIPGEVGAAAVQNIGAYGVEFKDVAVAISVYDVKLDKHVIVSVDECQYGYRTSLFKQPDYKQRFIVTGALLGMARKAPFMLDYGNIKAALLERGFTLLQGADRKRGDRSMRGKPITLHAMRDAILSVRDSKLPDPKVLGNAGSFFKNPVIERSRYEELLAAHPDMPKYDVDETHVKVPAGWLIEHAGCRNRSVGDACVYPQQCLVIVNRGHASADEIVQLSRLIVETVNERYAIRLEPEVNFI
ncbi:MAG: UDP-N-acetylmuramate dehydrogenase [Bacteroidales bacterium]|nr:UDP-N-acetylmuramate dehydrogenase [Bacteroidales bacterium]